MRRLLIADDSTTIRRVVQHTFRGTDIEVVAVDSGQQALEYVRRLVPDILLCDVLMPEMSGYEVLEQIKSDPATASVPVLLLTGAFEPFDEERAARGGAAGFLAKPFESRVLLARVEEVFAVSGPVGRSPDSRVDFADLAERGDTEVDEPLGPLPPFPEGWGAPHVPLPGDADFRLEGREAAAPRAPTSLPAVERARWSNALRAAPSIIDDAAIRDEIRRRLAEIAPDIVREIAWEVVPDLLERLLREQVTPPIPRERPGEPHR